MSYIEKEKLIKADIASIENKVRHAFNQGYDLGFKDGKEKAKPLEQEPILDKIRAEIESKIIKKPNLNFKMWEREHNEAFLEVLGIIDKYKAETEKNMRGANE